MTPNEFVVVIATANIPTVSGNVYSLESLFSAAASINEKDGTLLGELIANYPKDLSRLMMVDLENVSHRISGAAIVDNALHVKIKPINEKLGEFLNDENTPDGIYFGIRGFCNNYNGVNEKLKLIAIDAVVVNDSAVAIPTLPKAIAETAEDDEYAIVPREDRIYLGQTVYGLYTLGLAGSDSERIDEDCAMDNMRVPYYKKDLTSAQRSIIATGEAFKKVALKSNFQWVTISNTANCSYGVDTAITVFKTILDGLMAVPGDGSALMSALEINEGKYKILDVRLTGPVLEVAISSAVILETPVTMESIVAFQETPESE
jgi:hypothetical protein